MTRWSICRPGVDAGPSGLECHATTRPPDHLLSTQLSEDQLAAYRAMLDAEEWYVHAKLVALAVDFDWPHDRKRALGLAL